MYDLAKTANPEEIQDLMIRAEKMRSEALSKSFVSFSAWVRGLFSGQDAATSQAPAN